MGRGIRSVDQLTRVVCKSGYDFKNQQGIYTCVTYDPAAAANKTDMCLCLVGHGRVSDAFSVLTRPLFPLYPHPESHTCGPMLASCPCPLPLCVGRWTRAERRFSLGAR